VRLHAYAWAVTKQTHKICNILIQRRKFCSTLKGTICKLTRRKHPSALKGRDHHYRSICCPNEAGSYERATTTYYTFFVSSWCIYDGLGVNAHYDELRVSPLSPSLCTNLFYNTCKSVPPLPHHFIHSVRIYPFSPPPRIRKAVCYFVLWNFKTSWKKCTRIHEFHEQMSLWSYFEMGAITKKGRIARFSRAQLWNIIRYLIRLLCGQKSRAVCCKQKKFKKGRYEILSKKKYYHNQNLKVWTESHTHKIPIQLKL